MRVKWWYCQKKKASMFDMMKSAQTTNTGKHLNAEYRALSLFKQRLIAVQ